MKLAKIFSINVKKLLILNGWSYPELADRCNGKLSRAYVSNFRYGDRINPTLEVVDIISRAFNISPQQLLNPNLSYDKYTALPPGYFRKEYLVDEFQDITISAWEQKNKEILELRRKEGIPDFR